MTDPNTFRGMEVLYRDGSWLLIKKYPEGTEIWVNPQLDLWRKVIPDEEQMDIEWTALILQNTRLNLQMPKKINGINLIVTDLGEPWTYRRTYLGWEGAHNEIRAFEQTLILLFPAMTHGDIELHNITVMRDDLAVSPDWKLATIGKELVGQVFPCVAEYVFYVHEQLSRSWEIWFQEHSDETDLVQEEREERGAEFIETPPAELNWDKMEAYDGT